MSDLETIQVLHVDDEPSFGDLVAGFLERENTRFDVVTETEPDDALSLLDSDEPGVDCIVSDYDMPRMDGIEFLDTVRKNYPDCPFILYTGKGSEEVASEAISKGATDYLQKGSGTEQYELLANRIQNAVEQYRSKQQAANLDRIRTLVADVNQTLVRAGSADEIENRVCEIVSESDPYVAACFAEVDRKTMQIEPQTWAGDAAGYFEELDMSVDGGSPGRHAPGGQAFHDREIAVSQNIQEDSQYETWRDAATKRGFRSLAVVPIEYEDQLHGLLAMFAARPNAFDETEQDLLVEIGDDLAHALHTQALQVELQQTSVELNTILEQVPTGLILMDYDGSTFRYRRFNCRMEELSGLSSDEIRNKTPQEVLGTEDGATVEERYQECIEREEPVEYTSTFKVAGEEVIRKGIVTPVQTGNEIEQLVVVIQDVTEERQQRRQLKETTARLKALFENSPDMINIHDREGEIINPNPKLSEKTGYSESELLEMKVWELDSENTSKEVRCLWNEMDIGDSRRFESKYQREDGSTFPVEVHLRRLDLAGEDRFVAISRDITDRRETERKRQQIINRMDNAVIEVDSEWQITLVNEMAEEFSGQAESELLGENFWDIFADARGTPFEEEYRRAMNAREQISMLDHYSGVDEWFDIRVYPNKNGGLAFYFQSVTEYKQRQNELRQTERRYQAILEDPNILAGVLDTDGTLLEQNQTAVEYIDAETEDVLGEPFWETPWWPTDMQPVIREKVEQAANGEYVDYKADLTKPNGDSYTVSGDIRPVTDEDGQVVSLVVSARDVTKQKQREQEFEEANQRFEYLAEAVPNGLFLVSADYSELYYCNSAATDLYAVDVTEVQADPTTWTRHVHPADLNRLQDDMRAQKEGRVNGKQQQRFRIQHPERGTRWLETNIYPVEENGEVTRLAGVATDITERKRRTRTLEQYEKIVETMDDIAFVVSEDRTIEFVNQSILAYVDGTRDDLIGQPVIELADMYVATDDDTKRFKKTVERAFQRESNDWQSDRLELTLNIDSENKVFEYQFSPLTINGDTEAIVVVMRDITRHKRRKEELEETKERMEMALDRTNSVIWERNVDSGKITTYPEPCPLMDMPIGTVEEFRETIHPDDRSEVAETALDVIKSGESATVEYRTVPSSDTGWIRCQIEPITEPDGTVSRLIGLNRDITEQKHRESTLEKQNQRFDELASAVSHDLQTPLATARGRTELAIETGETTHMEEVLTALERVDELRDGIVEVLRTRELVQEREKVAVGELVNELWETILPAKNASLELSDSPIINADPTAVRRLFENLLLNAVEHGGNDVTITVGGLQSGFFIEDDGPGVPPENRDDIFNPGFSTKDEGNGIGLASIREIVTAHDWTVSVAESENGGARFEIRTNLTDGRDTDY